MSTLKLLGLGMAWILASIAIAVVAAIVLTELLDVIGIVESGETSYTFAINTILLAVFVVLVLIPYLFRDRFMPAEADEPDE
ncbi:MAG: hypothetical protein ABFR95_01570 [Actinomycetota bacterium]